MKIDYDHAGETAELFDLVFGCSEGTVGIRHKNAAGDIYDGDFCPVPDCVNNTSEPGNSRMALVWIILPHFISWAAKSK